MTLRDCLLRSRTVSYAAAGTPAELTVARAVVRELTPNAGLRPRVEEALAPEPGELLVEVSQLPREPLPAGRHDPLAPGPVLTFRIDPDGTGRLSASRPEGLYALFCLVRDRWLSHDAAEFLEGRTVRASFGWLRDLSDYAVGSLRSTRRFDRESFVRHLARLGFTHLTVNGLGVHRPHESGPPGDVYSVFYDYSPDLDQFVDSALVRGSYPADYLEANLGFLQRNAALARKYGLVPGLHLNSPRSMPEEFWSRFAFLRGARIDHPRESFRPRYTLALAHPAVQAHYRELFRHILESVPDLGFVHLWTNDSGAGFEFVSSLYAGRNGGPYLIREWKDGDQIARSAADNVLSYLRLIREEGRKANPAFRLVCDLGPFFLERGYIIDGLDEGIDAGAFGYFGDQDPDRLRLREAGVAVHTKVEASLPNIIGAPFPRLLAERLREARGERTGVLTDVAPPSLAPYDINSEIVRAAQFEPEREAGDVLQEAAARWVGQERAATLIELWDASDDAVRAIPPGVPGSTFAFPWFRYWVRPLVPDFEAIPEEERAYYERFLVATFNNPARVDLNNDMLWNFLTVPQAREKKEAFDARVLPPLDGAVQKAAAVLAPPSLLEPAKSVFLDLRDRMVALRCFVTTLRNCMAWTESVHGCLEAASGAEKEASRALCREMVINELENTKRLLELWQRTTIDFIPVSAVGETAHIYGGNFGELLKRKIALMERHMDDLPRIDPDFMWRMPGARPGPSGASPEEPRP